MRNDYESDDEMYDLRYWLREWWQWLTGMLEGGVTVAVVAVAVMEVVVVAVVNGCGRSVAPSFKPSLDTALLFSATADKYSFFSLVYRLLSLLLPRAPQL